MGPPTPGFINSQFDVSRFFLEISLFVGLKKGSDHSLIDILIANPENVKKGKLKNKKMEQFLEGRGILIH